MLSNDDSSEEAPALSDAEQDNLTDIWLQQIESVSTTPYEAAESVELEEAPAVGHSEGGGLDEGPAVVPPPACSQETSQEKS